MKQLAHLKAKAILLRTTRNYSLDEIASMLALPRTTVYSWIKDIPLGRPPRQNDGQKSGTASMVAKYAARREDAYQKAYLSAPQLLLDREVRDFVVLYLAEGYRKNRNQVSLANSNPHIVVFAHLCMRRLSTNSHFRYSFQYHADQDPDELRAYWASQIGVEAQRISAIPKTNSGQLKHRRFACEYGVFQIQVSDTLFRSQLQALMDVVQEQWASDALSKRVPEQQL